jgi:uncharacterized protein (TIGR02301 family)
MLQSRAWRALRLTIILARRPMLRILLIVFLSLCLGAAAARSQTWLLPQPPPKAQPQPPPQAKPQVPGQPAASPQTQPNASPRITSAPYDRDLQRLSEILGSLHFLRGICGANEGEKWRAEAQTLIEAEAPTGERHDLMIASFNRGYRSFQQSYRTCTPAADFAIRRYLDEGAKIARDITARYAN